MYASFYSLKNWRWQKGKKTIFDLSQIVKTLKFAFYGLKKEPWAKTKFGSSLWVIIGLLGNEIRVPGTPDQKKIYAIRSLGLNVIIHFSNEQYDSVDKARIIGRKQ